MPLVKGTGKDVRILIFYVSIGCGNIMSKTLVVHLGYWYNYSNIARFFIVYVRKICQKNETEFSREQQV